MHPEIVLPVIIFNADGEGESLYCTVSFITGMTTLLPITRLDLMAELWPIMSIAMTSPEEGGQRDIFECGTKTHC